jgi:hypothetical protein
MKRLDLTHLRAQSPKLPPGLMTYEYHFSELGANDLVVAQAFAESATVKTACGAETRDEKGSS